MLAGSHGLYTRSGCGPRPGSNGGAFSATGNGANDGSQGSRPADYLGGSFTPSSAGLCRASRLHVIIATVCVD